MILSTHKIFPSSLVSDEMREAMRVRNPAFTKAHEMGFSTRKIPAWIPLYLERGDEVLVPRNYTAPFLPQGPVVDERVEGEAVEFNFHIDSFWEGQEAGVDALSQMTDGILVAGCGSGKTVIGVAALARVGRPTLVLVTKEPLISQWEDTCRKLLGPEVKLGKIQGKKCDWRSKDIVIAMIQSLSINEYESEMYSYFGLVISDEAHRVGAPTWGKVVGMFPAKRRWGLTATPNRDDGLDAIIRAHIGAVDFEVQTPQEVPEVYEVRTSTTADLEQFKNHYTQKLAISGVVTALAVDPVRNRLIVKYLLQAAQAGRKILVLGDRIAQLDVLLELARPGLAEKGVSAGLYIGKLQQDKRKDAAANDVIFATMSLAKEGLDIPRLDTLFLITPQGSPITTKQAVGRVMRKYPGKLTPMVVDFVDSSIPIFAALYNKRCRVYRELNCIIKSV